MKKILIVEDDQVVATAYRRRFAEAGWQVECAPDGIEGIKAVGIFRPDVVLLDLLMPRLDGIDVLRYIRSNPDHRHLPVLVFSNSYMTSLIENAFRSGADQCLMKASTTPQNVLDAVNKAIKKAETRQANAILAASIPRGSLSAPKPNRPLAPAVSLVTPNLPAPTWPSHDLAPQKPAESPAASEAPAPISQVDQEFQSQIRQLFLSSARSKLQPLRDGANALAGHPADDSPGQIAILTDLFRKVHSLTSNAAVAGCPWVAQYTSTVEAFIRELEQKPRFINVSTIRTILGAIDFMGLLFQHTSDCQAPEALRRVLVADGDPMSGQTISLTLEKAGWRAHLAGDPIEAMALASTEYFDLVITAADLPGMTGFEATAQLQTLPGCENVPVLFVSTLEDFPAHSEPEVLGNNEIITRPFLVIELTLKVTTMSETRRLRAQTDAAA